MKTQISKMLWRLAVAIVLPSVAAFAQSGGYNLGWNSVDGGGGSCSGGLTPAGGTRFTLSGTVGQPDAGGSAAGTYLHQGGFIPAFTLPATPSLTMSRSGNVFTFTWPNVCTGFVLEASSSPNGPVWTSLGSGTVVGPNRQIVVLAPTSPVFWRLRKNCPASCASDCPK